MLVTGSTDLHVTTLVETILTFFFLHILYINLKCYINTFQQGLGQMDLPVQVAVMSLWQGHRAAGSDWLQVRSSRQRRRPVVE